MIKQIIDRVTVTGADDSIINPWRLVEIAEEYPFVEFGILLSKKQEGYKRFPSLSWLKRFVNIAKMQHLKLSGHLCGLWLRDLCLGGSMFFKEREAIAPTFDRIQFNFHAEPHRVNMDKFLRVLRRYEHREFIFQIDGVNEEHFFNSRGFGLDVVPLFDSSGGAGILPDKWPEAIGCYCGYAGGLSSENLPEQLEKIAEAAGDMPIWIDAERHLRSPDDKQFNLDKVRDFLEVAIPWVIK